MHTLIICGVMLFCIAHCLGLLGHKEDTAQALRKEAREWAEYELTCRLQHKYPTEYAAALKPLLYWSDLDNYYKQPDLTLEAKLVLWDQCEAKQ